MATKKTNDLDDVMDKGERYAKRTLKKKIKNLHPLTKALAILFLIVGIAAGVLVCSMLSKNDRFVLKGSTQISIDAGTSYVYAEEGYEAVAFGMDCAGKVQVEPGKGVTTDENGNFVIPAEEGVYTITYTVNSLKFNGKLGGERIQRIRVFTVDAIEEDGRNG
jgi:hypothetical protein